MKRSKEKVEKLDDEEFQQQLYHDQIATLHNKK